MPVDWEVPESGTISRGEHLKTLLAGIARAMMGHWAREQVLRLFDAAVWIVGAYVAGSVWFGVSLEAKGWIHLMLAYVFPLVAFMLYTPMGCYRSWRSLDYFSVAKPVVLSIILVGITALTFTFLMHEISALSRVWFLLTLSFVLGTSVSVRIAAVAIMRWLRRNGSDLRRILLVGDAQSLDGMRRSVADNPGFGYSIVSTLDYVETASVSILDIMAGKNIDEVWMTSSPVTMDCMSPLIAELSRTPVSVRWIPDIKWHALLSAREENLMGHPSFLLNATAIDGSQGRLLKAVFDRFFALLVLVVLSPLFLCIAVLVKLTSPGPVIFRQARQGISGRSFHCLKFRTMVTHSEENGLTQATVNDRRVTPLGAFLRRTSLDELPQFINVLLGDMSVVGPRPHAIQHNEFYTKQVYGYMQRHRTKPGITGWAQINGYRGETDTLQKMIKRVEYDIYYMKNWSFLLDLKIIFATAFSGWMGRNAY